MYICVCVRVSVCEGVIIDRNRILMAVDDARGIIIVDTPEVSKI